MAQLMVKFTDDLCEHVRYDLIAETAESSAWNTGRRKRLWTKTFNPTERDICNRLIRQAKTWVLRIGQPKQIFMTVDTLKMWQKLEEFCASL